LISTIGRPIDLRYSSNRFAVAAALGAGVIAGAVALISGTSFTSALGWGVQGGAASFLAWAIGRELDPDRPVAAGIAAAAALPLLLLGRIALGATAAVLLAVRITVRTVGPAPTMLDALLLMGFGGYLGYRGTWPAGLALGIALAASGWEDRRLLGAGGATAIAALGLAAVAGKIGSDPVALAPAEVSVGIVAIVAGIVTLRRERPDAVCDLSRERLQGSRLLAGRVLALATIAALVFYLGSEPIGAMGPAAAAMMATAVTVTAASFRRARS
jgi:hypothetical protein